MELEETRFRTIKECAAGIQAFLKQEFQPGSAMTPLEHFVMKQTCLGSVKILIRLEKEKLAYDDIREHFENLGSLLDLLTSRSTVACVVRYSNSTRTDMFQTYNSSEFKFEFSSPLLPLQYLSKLMVMSMRVMKELCGHLEDLAGRQVTDWVKVSATYEQFYSTYWKERSVPRPPALRYFSKCQAIG